MLLTFEAIALPVGISGLVVLLAILWCHKRSPLQIIYFSIFWFYIIIVIGVTIFPIPILDDMVARQPDAYIVSRVNLVPLHFGRLFDLNPKVILRELAGNILLTLPIGFGYPFLSRLRGKQILWLAIGVGFAIEMAQLIISLWIGGAYRGVDINDILLNATGILIGYGFFRSIAWLHNY